MFIILIIIIFFLVVFVSSLPEDIKNVTTIFKSNLNGICEVPPVKTYSTGDGVFILITKNNLSTLSYEIKAQRLCHKRLSQTRAKIHFGKKNNNGPVIKSLCEGKICNGVYTFKGTWDSNDIKEPLTESIIKKLNNGELYVNIHTDKYPDGEIRGQINYIKER